MTDHELAMLVNARFDAIDRQLAAVVSASDSDDARFATSEQRTAAEIAAIREELAGFAQEVRTMTDAYSAFRTAMYAAAGAILVAALIVVLFGSHIK